MNAIKHIDTTTHGREARAYGRSVARLNETTTKIHAEDYSELFNIDGIVWSRADIVGSVIDHTRRAVTGHSGVGSMGSHHAMSNITTATVTAMLIAVGASSQVTAAYAKTIARAVRSLANHRVDDIEYRADKGGKTLAWSATY